MRLTFHFKLSSALEDTTLEADTSEEIKLEEESEVFHVDIIPENESPSLTIVQIDAQPRIAAENEIAEKVSNVSVSNIR